MSVAAYTRAQERLFSRFGVVAESRFVDLSPMQGRAHVLVAGEGPPVVMVPGGGAPGAGWAPLMAELRGFRLYAVERPGFGLSDTASHTKGGLRRLAVGFLEQVLDGLGLDRPTFIANSMGSLWASWLALDRTDRVGALVHIGCPALILGTSAPLPMRLMSIRPLGRLMMRLQAPSAKQVDRMFSMMKDDVTALPELRDLTIAMEELDAFAPTWLELLHSVIGLRGARREAALTEDELARIVQPTQFIWGKDDPFGSPAVGERAARIIPDAEMHSIPGGHVPWLSRAQRIAEIATPFLQEHAEEKHAPRSGITRL